MQLASTRPASEDRTWTSARTDQHFEPERMQRDSVSRAEERRMDFSRRRERRVSVSVWLCGGLGGVGWWGFERIGKERGGDVPTVRLRRRERP